MIIYVCRQMCGLAQVNFDAAQPFFIFPVDKRKVLAYIELPSVSVLGNVSAAERRQAEAQGIELVPVSLQQLIVHLTNGKTNGKVAELG
ncbi:hypothetical protein J2TS6_14820 [Paenibacillus albilobatus]|uniref:Uncharacterized protein n=1 Tax=Paenibacillus albilobatus TaxID=2716884 RepID=A0A920C8P7_9BACL|nr:hypothetical protein [Paenibacillus albilobatus]GIO30341.1 hypothetical protein J2TS6_14820 [Paenibacillus albilobatus]